MDGLEENRPRPPVPRADCALFLDVDGSLVELASTPERVIVTDALRRRLHLLCESLGGALALVSGRSVEAIDAMFHPLRLPVAGLHGHQLRIRDDAPFERASPPGMSEVLDEALALSRAHAGSLVEDKGASLALHWRNAPAAEGALRAFAERARARLPGYRLQPGHCVIELLPEGCDKGRAIAALLATPPFRGRSPVFVGDDLTDEPGFREVNARSGISVLVGTRQASDARFTLPDPASVHVWLDTMLNGDSE